jgi:hypothetical protein
VALQGGIIKDIACFRVNTLTQTLADPAKHLGALTTLGSKTLNHVDEIGVIHIELRYVSACF